MIVDDEPTEALVVAAAAAAEVWFGLTRRYDGNLTGLGVFGAIFGAGFNSGGLKRPLNPLVFSRRTIRPKPLPPLPVPEGDAPAPAEFEWCGGLVLSVPSLFDVVVERRHQMGR